MSKELEALEPSVLLEFIDGLLKRYENKTDYNIYITKDWLLEIKKAIKRLESIDNSNPSEALKCLERIDNTLCLNNIKGKLEFGIDTEEHTDCDSVIGMTEDLEAIKQALLKAQEQEKENELLKEIIKSLFDRGCPLHQYTDKEGVLTIEVDSECSIMRIGIYKGVDLDKKLKEVLE